jgi:D-alanyl-D-alanine carboxypeptidase/D-alanyl-D-alanine-endopeptidase (penicillin-binding protein 4)
MFETSQVALVVYDLDGDSTIYQYNARQLMRPASNMKLVTAITALDKLGGDYQFKTKICYTGTISDGTLTGNIYCVGGFDPTLTVDDVAVMAERVRDMGIDSISGNIIGDRQMKEVLDYGEGWCWDDDNPMLIPLTIGRKDTFLPVFARELQRQGIRMSGVGLLKMGLTPNSVHTICTYRHSMDDVLQRMMKVSDNFYAEAMFYQTAAATGHRPAKATDAATVTRQLIKRLGLEASDYRIADGSGLSLYNYVTAELLIKLLRHAYRKKDIHEHLLPSLPIAGIDGTLKKRMTDGDAKGNVMAKTGTVTGVSSLSGYVTTADGRQLCFSIINQGIMNSETGRSFQDRVCQELARYRFCPESED